MIGPESRVLEGFRTTFGAVVHPGIVLPKPGMAGNAYWSGSDWADITFDTTSELVRAVRVQLSNGSSIRCALDTTFYCVDGRVIPLDDLQEGTVLMTNRNSPATITAALHHAGFTDEFVRVESIKYVGAATLIHTRGVQDLLVEGVVIRTAAPAAATG